MTGDIIWKTSVMEALARLLQHILVDETRNVKVQNQQSHVPHPFVIRRTTSSIISHLEQTRAFCLILSRMRLSSVVLNEKNEQHEESNSFLRFNIE